MTEGVSSPVDNREPDTDHDPAEQAQTTTTTPTDSASPDFDVDPEQDGVPLTNSTITDRWTKDLLFDFRQPVAELLENPNYELVRRYWLNKPFAYTAILKNTTTSEEFYHVVQPGLREDEAEIYNVLKEKLRDQLIYRVDASVVDDQEAKVEEKVREVIQNLSGYSLSDGSLQKVLYYLKRDLIRFERIDPLMQDPELEEISINGAGPEKPVYVYHREFENLQTNIYYEEEQLSPFVRKIAQRSGQDISTANPLQGTSLPNGSRVQLSLDEVTPEGESVTIRKFRETPFTPVDLIQYGTFTARQMAYLWILIENGYSGIIAGGTGSGKTTTLNSLAMFIPPGKKVITIEDTREVKIPQQNYIATLTREAFSHSGSESDTGINMFDLLRASLRMRPDYLAVGEVRGEEAHNMFQAMNTGHTTFSTLHADSMKEVLNRLESEPMAIPKTLVSGLGFVCMQTHSGVDGEAVRRNQGIYEVEGLDTESDEIVYLPTWEWDQATDQMQRPDDSVHIGALRRQGHQPREAYDRRTELLNYLAENGIDGYQHVSTIIRAFMRAPEVVIQQVRDDDLNINTLEAIEGGILDAQ